MKKKKSILIFVICALVFATFVLLKFCNVTSSVSTEKETGHASLQEPNEAEQEVPQKEEIPPTDGRENISEADEILGEIDKYQKRYFSIIKRNNYFLQAEPYDGQGKDERDLADLYRTVKGKIDAHSFLDKYETIEKTYAENPGKTTYEIDQFNARHREAVDHLLNEVYKEVKQKISPKQFAKLKISEQNWIREVTAYRKVFDSMWGDAQYGKIILCSYETDMENFRALLLMLYL